MKPFYIDYPQDSDSKTHTHWCKFCKISTTIINGKLENHDPRCEYRLEKEVELHEKMMASKTAKMVGSVVDDD